MSFNGSLRDKLLNEEWFPSLDEARQKMALCQYDCNRVRPHSLLENKTPADDTPGACLTATQPN
jgi:putative transposase